MFYVRRVFNRSLYGYAYLVVFCLLFSPEYMHRFVQMAADFGNVICLVTATVAAAGIINLTYSIIWQILYNRRLRDSIVQHKELMKNRQYMQRQESVRKQLKLGTVFEDEEYEPYDAQAEQERNLQEIEDQFANMVIDSEETLQHKTPTRRTPGLRRSNHANKQKLMELEEAADNPRLQIIQS